MAKKRYKNDMMAALHETAEGFHAAGVIDKVTMRHFDDACLMPVEEFGPEDIVALRKQENVSQPVLARYLNVTKNEVSDWERGKRKPSGPAMRLLSLVKRNGLNAIAL